MGTSSWNSGDWARFGAAALIGGPVGAVAGYGLNTKRNTEAAARAAARAARGQAETSAKEAQTQAAIAEDERLRRLRLLQGGSANAMEEATGRRTLLGQ